MIFLEATNGGGYGALIAIILAIMLAPAVILALFGWRAYRKGNSNTSKKLFISAVAYMIISLGLCGAMMG